jgi:hypothetical protein
MVEYAGAISPYELYVTANEIIINILLLERHVRPWDAPKRVTWAVSLENGS